MAACCGQCCCCCCCCWLWLQIEPREVEIDEMRETIRAMDAELERYHKSNAGLDLTIQVSSIGPIGAWCRLYELLLAL